METKNNFDEYWLLMSLYRGRFSNLNLLYTLKSKISECPASTKYHGAHKGGLLDHILNVCNIINSIDRYCIVGITEEERQSLVFCALVHDLGKLGNIKEDYYLPNCDSNNSAPFVINKNLVSMSHELRTFYWLNLLGATDLSEEEIQTIYYHAGPYNPNYLNEVKKESKLLLLLHTADNISSKLIEKR